MKFHAANGRKKEERALVFRETRRRRDPSGLRECFGQNHPRHERVARKMSGKHRIVCVKRRGAFGRETALKLDQLTDENEWRAMRQA